MRKIIPILLIATCLTVGACLVGCQSQENQTIPILPNNQTNSSANSNNAFSTSPECSAYDRTLFTKIEHRWDDYLSAKQLTPHKPGKVVVRFKLHSDGSISDLTTIEKTDSLYELVCLKTVTTSAPFPKWPDEMHKLVQKDYRDIVFTFYYDTEK
jgi:hypothetical protein